MKTRYTLFLLVCLLPFGGKCFSQMVGDNVFLQGAFVEIGIAPNGGFGSTANAPAGYHPHNPGGDYFYDPLSSPTSSTSYPNHLGFVADYGADGWAVGTPPFFGDFYLPGTPQEGWAIEINGVESDAYIPSYEYGPSGFTGGLSGTNVSYSNVGGVIQGVWQGQDNVAGGGVLSIRQTTTLDTSKLFFVVTVILTNTGPTTLSNIFYFRTVDPDNDETEPGGSFVTDNTITDQLPDPGNKVLVSATGTTYTDAYLGLGTKDTRAKCMIFNSGLTPSYSIDSLYTQSTYIASTGYVYAMGSEYTADVGIGLDYNIGTLVPGQCTYLTYAYILNATYIDSALNATETVGFVVDGTAEDTSLVSINACTDPADTVGVTLANSSNYSWSWSPSTYLASDTGAHNVIYIHSIPDTTTYTITGINIVGGCDTPRYYVTIYAGPSPGPVVGPVNYCQGSSSSPLTAPGAYQLWYTTPGGIGSPVAPIPSTAVADTQIYYVSDSNNFCRTNLSIDTVTVVASPPSPVVTEPASYCDGAPFVPFATSDPATLWYTAPVGGTSTTIAPVINTSMPGTYTFYVSDTDVTIVPDAQVLRCESPRIPVTVAVEANPATFITASTHPSECGASDATITLGDYVPFTADTVNYTYNGTPYPPFPAYTNSDSGIVLTGLKAGTYSNIVVLVGQCIYSVTGAVTLDSPKIQALYDTSIHLGCHGDTVFFNNNSSSFFAGARDTAGTLYYNWTFGDGTADSSTSPYHIYQQGTYTVTLVADDHLCWDTTSFTVTLFHPLFDSFSATPATFNVCQDSLIQFTNYSSGTPGQPVYYNWYFGDGGTSTLTNPAPYSYAHSGTYDAMLVAHDYVPCYDTFTTVVQVDTLSNLNVLATDTVICQGTDITFTGLYAGLGNTGITWYIGSDSVLNVNPLTYAAGSTGTFTVTTVAYYRACKNDTATHKITVLQTPVINLGADTSICAGSAAITLVDNINAGTAGASWMWNTGQTTPAITVNSAGVYYATVDVNNCYATDSVVVTNDCYMDIPNAFTPNHDGSNDYFYPRQLLTKGLVAFKMDIYNRWGELIFETTTLDGSGWDGKLNGTDQPEGVYVYVIDGTFKDGQKEHHQGNITLLR